MSARTLETNRTSVSFPPAGRSLLQVPARNLLPAMKSNLFTVNMGSEIKLISWLSISVQRMLRVESFTPCLCHLFLVPCWTRRLFRRRDVFNFYSCGELISKRDCV